MESDVKSRVVFVSSLLPIMSLIMIGVDVISLIVINRCIRLSSQYKVLTKNLLTTDLSLHVALLVGLIVIVSLPDKSDRVFTLNCLLVVLSGIVVLYCMFVILIGVEHFISLQYPHRYHVLLPPHKLVRVVVGIYGAVFILFTSIIASIGLRCKNTPDICRNEVVEVFLIPRFILTGLFGICEVIIIVIGVYIINVVNNQANQLRLQYPDIKLASNDSSFRIAFYIGAFAVLSGIVCLPTFLIDTLQVVTNQQGQAALRVLAFICMGINTCVTQYYYVSARRECRLVFWRMLCVWSEESKAEFNRKRIEIYNIPTRDI